MGKFKKEAYNRNEGINWQMTGQHAAVAAGASAAGAALASAVFPPAELVIPATAAALGGTASTLWDIGGSLLYKFKSNKKKLSQLANDVQDQLTNLYKALPPKLQNTYGPQLLSWIQNYKKYIDDNVMNVSDEDNIQKGVNTENYQQQVALKTKWFSLYRWSINQMAPQNP